MFIRQGTGLQGQALFRTKLTFRPHSTESFTHRKMTLSLADRSQKTSGIKVLSQVGHDPDQNRYEKIKVCFFSLLIFAFPVKEGSVVTCAEPGYGLDGCSKNIVRLHNKWGWLRQRPSVCWTQVP